MFPPDPGTGPDWAYGLLGFSDEVGRVRCIYLYQHVGGKTSCFSFLGGFGGTSIGLVISDELRLLFGEIIREKERSQ